MAKKAEKIPLNPETWDSDKTKTIFNLLSQRYDDELNIAKSFQTRAVFFITTLGVIVTLIITLVFPKLKSWADADIAILIIILSFLGFSVVLYFILYYKADRVRYPQKHPSDKELNSSILNNSTEHSLLQNYIKSLYREIEQVSRKR